MIKYPEKIRQSLSMTMLAYSTCHAVTDPFKPHDILLIEMQHHGKAIEHGPDWIILLEAKTAAAFAGHQ